ncbi:hypothetical protein BGZ65_011799 [Modicella reniformis]|uniref:Uncharacterized protein n=1 Tax=Modicella reniformis TaxID=1440133 RepID=A0A9P6SR27_9FUNG|nr:hypothetical protein BGZ65_011799 [Modicella reniformis]
MSVNKALLDILRFATTAAYLRINHLQGEYEKEEKMNVVDFPVSGVLDLPDHLFPLDPLSALGLSMILVAQGFTAIANLFKNTITEAVKSKVCLGFERYSHIVKTAAFTGIDKDNFPEVIEQVVTTAQLPNNDDLKSIMLGVKYSETEFTWTGESMIYTAPDGNNHFLYLTKHADPKTNKVDLIYGMVNAQYSLAADLFIVNKKTSILGSIFQKQETEFKTIPHTLSFNDTALLEMYFETIVFRKIALMTGLSVPDFPDLSSLCDRSD